MKEAAVVLIVRETEVPIFPVGFQREILTVTSRKFSTLVLPGGTIDPGEQPVATAIRELREEISVNVEPQHLAFVGRHVSSYAKLDDWLVHAFYAKQIWGQPTEIECGTRLRWVTFEQFMKSTFFTAYYRELLPRGIEFFPSTKVLGSAA